MAEILDRMKAIGMTQVDMMFCLRERGYDVNPPEMSNILRGLYTYPKAKKIIAECDKILKEREA